MLLFAGGAFVLIFLAVVVFRLSQDDCQNSVSLDRQAEGGVIKAPTTLHPEISPSHCIRRVSYLLDGVEVGERRFFPFEMEMSDPALLPTKLGKRGRYELSVVVEGAGGKIVNQPKTWWVVFDGGSGAASGDAKGDSPKEPTGVTPAADVDVVLLKQRSLQFAAVVTRRSDHVLSDEFLALVKKKLPAYAAAYQSAAPHISKDWRQNINVAFSYFDPPYIGYVLALSRSGFDPAKERSGGAWQIPPEAAEMDGLTAGDAKSNESSAARAAARYSRRLLHAFDNDYVLMAAYYGLTIEEAGKRNAEIARIGLGDAARADIKSLSEMRVLGDEQINNLADFFAAGVVVLYPREFGADAPTVLELAQ